MNANIATEFANSLIRKTLSDEIKWQPLTDVMNVGGEPITDLFGYM